MTTIKPGIHPANNITNCVPGHVKAAAVVALQNNANVNAVSVANTAQRAKNIVTFVNRVIMDDEYLKGEIITRRLFRP